MCGIVGAVGSLYNRVENVRGLVHSLVHRGPDEGGEFHDADCSMAMRRLSVIDLAGGRQPLYNESSDLVCICNGELYNFAAIRETLAADGHRFSTRSDVEVLVHGYESWGQGVLQKINGMFAFAIWDSRRGELLLARDRLGKKPLYYALVEGGLLFASELRTLLAWPNRRWTVDRQACREFCLTGYVPGSRTPIVEIHRLPPGHSGLWSRGSYTQRRYWEAHPRPPARDSSTAADQLMELLSDSVRLRLISDVPVGAFLSGGLDSSIIVALAAGVHRARIPTFSVSFPEHSSHNESRYARRIAAHFRCEHHEIAVSPSDFRDPEAFIWALDDPIADPAALPTLLLSRAARTQVTVALTGEGADEVFGGYDRYRLSLVGSKILANAPWLQAPAARALSLRGTRSWDDSRISRILRGVVTGGTSPLAWSRAIARAPVTGHNEAWNHPSLPPHNSSGDSERASYDASRLLPIQLDDLNASLPCDLLTKVDRMTMATSLEARCPYLDYRVVEFGLGLPDSWKMHGRTSKVLLRTVGAKLLPSDIRARPKHTFRVPLADWLRGPLKPLLDGLVRSDQLRRFGIAQPDHINPIARDHLEGRGDYSRALWALVTLDIWLQQADHNATLVPEP
jgi:asparagine synthase (glutamine-hydrolysing)